MTVDDKEKVAQEVVNSQEVKETNQNEESPEQINWKRFRETREKERKEKEAAERRASEEAKKSEALQKAMEALLNKPVAQQQQKTAYDYDAQDESQEDLIQRRIEEVLAKERVKEREAQKVEELRQTPTKLAQTFPDFNQVCSSENLDYLEYHYPEVAAPFKNLPDGFEKWAQVYRAVKRFIPNTDNRKDLAKIEKNLSKPQSISVPGTTSTGDHAPSQGLDEKRKSDNWARMVKRMKGG